jgi:hypothetical protein
MGLHKNQYPIGNISIMGNQSVKEAKNSEKKFYNMQYAAIFAAPIR